ncbi:uncharacterized protein C8Q71DRAFT_767364 [Rhodofomes roseus]|uniref:Uncharacterized protein n=1 Tax=Rhodofomes roseus TaxID=34475 RepID=A0ABQ8KC84_9APHY|nr:uncharacterized protein C8Q71DRAFT_767364 [Rhodofomes roseus]KAH9834917.1 hypothetical protein C8Q71DRAFT_767364 [Rhodofomes roseus]
MYPRHEPKLCSPVHPPLLVSRPLRVALLAFDSSRPLWSNQHSQLLRGSARLGIFKLCPTCIAPSRFVTAGAMQKLAKMSLAAPRAKEGLMAVLGVKAFDLDTLAVHKRVRKDRRFIQQRFLSLVHLAPGIRSPSVDDFVARVSITSRTPLRTTAPFPIWRRLLCGRSTSWARKKWHPGR